LTLGAGLLLAGRAHGAEPDPAVPRLPPRQLSLQEALSLAKAQHISSILANERVQQSIDRLGQSVSPLLPQVSGDSYQKRQTLNLQTLGITIPSEGPIVGPFNSFDARVSVTQTLFDMTVIQRLRAASAGRDQSEAERKKTEQDVLALVANLYIEAARAADSIEYTKALVRRDRKRSAVEHERLGIGTGSAVVLKRVEADLFDSRHLLENARAQAIERKLDLTAAIGLPANEKIVFVNPRLAEDPVRPTAAEIEQTKRVHPEVEAARQELRVREAERWAELAEFLPKISGFGDYGLSGKSPSNAATTYTMGIQGSISLFEGGASLFKVDEAESRIRESQARIRDVERHTEANILSSIQSLKSALAALSAREADLAAAAEENSIVRHRFETGTGSEVEVLETAAAESGARDARREAAAVYELAHVQLLHALGQVERLIGEK
jgi:outer membrane protein TolC